MRVLIADDSISSRFLLEQTLKKFGYDVISTKDGKEALDELNKEGAPQIAILDWMMPEMDGIEVCKKVREKKTNNPTYIILLTALGNKKNIVIGLSNGANDYISKPFDREELQARVQVGERFIELQNKLANQISELQNAVEHIKTLQGILPICMHCHKIRNDNEAWEKVEEYIEKNTAAEFSHSLCPECLDKYYPEEEEIEETLSET